jgi:hypothetical protein
MIYGFDLGKSVGVAWYDPEDKAIDSTTWDFTNNPTHALVFTGFQRHVASRFEMMIPELVVFEEPQTRMSKAWASIFYGLRAQLIVTCEVNQIPWVPVHPSEWKKLAGLSGIANKDEVQKLALKRWPDMPRRQDEMDARFIALAGLTVEVK